MSAFYDLNKTPRNILNQAIVRAIISENDGALFDPSDLSTLYQDAAGTIPVAAVEQPVGKMLDKSGNGNHATQSITASRPTLSARYNLLTKTEDFSAAEWAVSGCSAVKNYGVSPIGTITSSLLTNSAVGGYLAQADGVVGANKTLTAYIKNSSTGWVRIVIASLAAGKNGAGYFINTTTGAKGRAFTGGTGYSVVSCASEMQADGWVKVVLTVAGAREVQQPVLNIAQSDGNHSGPIGATVQLWGVDQRLGTTSGPYQRVNTATDYNTDERYFKKYLRFDGVDDYLNLPYMGLYANGSASTVMARDTIIPSSQQNYLTEASSTSTPPLYYLDFQLGGQLNHGFFIRNDANTQVALLSNNNGESVSTVSVKTMVDNGNNVKKYRNGTLLNSDNYVRSGTLALSNTLIGAIGYGTPVNFAKMNLYGLILTKSALTDSQRVACERFEARKSGVLM